MSSSANELENFDAQLRSFLENYYPHPSDAEIFVPTKKQLAKMVAERRFLDIHKITQDIPPSLFKSSGSDYLYYYSGMACWFIYQEQNNRDLLDEACKKLQIFCENNPEHGLANGYLEQALIALLEINQASADEKEKNSVEQSKAGGA